MSDTVEGYGHREGLTVRNTRNQMVRDMVVRHIVQEEASDPPEEGSVYRRDSPTDERPRVLAEVRHSRVGVM